MARDYFVDVPNSDDPDKAWVNLGTFDSYEAALEYVKSTFGADDNGRIGLISSMADDDEEARKEPQS